MDTPTLPIFASSWPQQENTLASLSGKSFTLKVAKCPFLVKASPSQAALAVAVDALRRWFRWVRLSEPGFWG